MRSLFVFLAFIFFYQLSLCQKSIEPTDHFTITGLVAKPDTIYFSDLERGERFAVGNIKILNHKGEFKKEYKNVVGVRLLDILKKVEILSPDARSLSEFYFVAKASDGYSVVISWNELFNSELSNSFIVVLETDNLSQKEAGERILLISTKDLMTGRRHVKGLKSIEIKRL